MSGYFSAAFSTAKSAICCRQCRADQGRLTKTRLPPRMMPHKDCLSGLKISLKTKLSYSLRGRFLSLIHIPDLTLIHIPDLTLQKKAPVQVVPRRDSLYRRRYYLLADELPASRPGKRWSCRGQPSIIMVFFSGTFAASFLGTVSFRTPSSNFALISSSVTLRPTKKLLCMEPA